MLHHDLSTWLWPQGHQTGHVEFYLNGQRQFYFLCQVTKLHNKFRFRPYFFSSENMPKMWYILQKVSEERVIAWRTSWGPEVNTSSSRHLLAPALDAGMFPLLCGLKPIKERKRSHPGHTRTVYLNHHWRGPPHFGPEPKYKQLWGERSRVLYFLMFFSIRLSHPAPLLRLSNTATLTDALVTYAGTSLCRLGVSSLSRRVWAESESTSGVF